MDLGRDMVKGAGQRSGVKSAGWLPSPPPNRPLTVADITPVGRGFMRALRKLLPEWLAPLVERIEALEKPKKLEDRTRPLVKNLIRNVHNLETEVGALREQVAKMKGGRR